MAMRTLIGGALFPTPAKPTGVSITSSSFTLNASGDRIGCKFFSPITGTLDRAEFSTGISTGVVVNGLKVSIQGVNATNGNPDGTAQVFRVIPGPTFTNDTWQITGLLTADGTDSGATLNVTRGQQLFLVIEFVTFVALDSWTFSSVNLATPNNCYFVTKTGGGAITKQQTMPKLALRYSDLTYPSLLPSAMPAKALNSYATSSTSSPDEIAMVFAFPAGVKVGGAQIRADTDGDLEVRLYDSQYNLLTTVAVDKDVRVVTTQNELFVIFPEEVLLSGNEIYYLSLRPTTATSINVPYFTVNDDTMLAYFDGGTTWFHATRTDLGNWTWVPNQKMFASLLVTSIETDSSGGSGS